MELALVISGASGMSLAAALARRMLAVPGVSRLHVVVSGPAETVLAHELGRGWGSAAGFCARVAEGDERLVPWRDDQLMAPVASGSHRLAGVVVLPCSSGMAGSLANGISRGLGQRVADVALKQRWPLVLGVRETPMSAVLLENLLRLARLGVHVVPPVPAFYLKPDPGEAMERFVRHYCMRVLDLLGLDAGGDEGLRWRC